MSTVELGWKAADGTPIFARDWEARLPLRAVVVLIHGLGEHSGRYDHVARAMNSAGYAVLGPDLRGHGCSEGKRGHISSYELAASDIQQALAEASTRHPGVPQFLYGHSLGGALVLYTALSRKLAVHGVIVTSPGLAPGSPVTGIKLATAKIFNTLAPSMTMVNGLDTGNLSHDPSIKTAYLADKYVHPFISTRLAMELINKGRWIQCQKGEFPLPLLLMQGTGDHLVDPAATRRFAQGLTGNVTYKEWEGWYHELHNETEKEEVLRMMIDWLHNQLS